ncbi:MAG: thiamine-monophosphate kinase [Pseudohongiellaceae bacterium]|jgi:thiamine-monophosphate kinase
MSLNEFSIIERYFSNISHSKVVASSLIDLGIGDDCSLLSIPEGSQLALSIDTLNANVHFPVEAKANLIAQRALAVAISDLAAMGATPFAFSLAISLPESNLDWLHDFSVGLQKAAETYDVALIGGDTTKGPLSITVQVKGLVPKGEALIRSGAQPGDLVYVTGSLGDAAAALAFMQGKLPIDKADQHFFKQRYYQPNARIAIGQSLLALATSAIDISDGLMADLGHIAKRSGCGSEITASDIPLSFELREACSIEQALPYALAGGDDYELCFTVQPDDKAQVLELSELMDVPITEIGYMVESLGVRCLDKNGQAIVMSETGYQHF